MKLYVYDFEVFRHDWLVVFKELATGEHTVIHNDNYTLKEFVTPDKILIGFNSKSYDSMIMKALLCGADNALVKELNDFIIAGNSGYEFWFIRENRVYFNNVDIKDDMQMGLSLKAIEGHLGMDIEESSVPFDIDRPLTEKELDETIRYCKHDVDTTAELVKLRKSYLTGKDALGSMVGLPIEKSLSFTNAKLTAQFLGAKRQMWNDERQVEPPENINLDILPKALLDFFNQVYDPSVPDDILWKDKLDLDIGKDTWVTYGWGGCHSMLKNFVEKETDDRALVNLDVQSLYPSIMINCGFTSRNIPDNDAYKRVYRDRLEAKRNGDMAKSDAYKLVLNSKFGAMNHEFNELYDPKMFRSVTISGQLYLTEFVVRLLNECSTIFVINFNTDGVLFSIDKHELDIVDTIRKEFEEKTGFSFEEVRVRKIIQKDINNYLMVECDGSVKTKGAYTNYGIPKAGAWNINNSLVIIKKALVEYFINGTSPEETINSCDDILQFQMIAKAGAKYREVYHMVDGPKMPIQKVNRVYATKDQRHGKLVKVKAENDSEAKIESLPDHCIIDNRNKLKITDIDKQWYIDLAHKRIKDFIGLDNKKIKKIKELKTMANKTEATAAIKLSFQDKLMVLQETMGGFSWEKDGVNRFQSYKYISEKQYKTNFKYALKKAGLLWHMHTVSYEYIPNVSDKMHMIVAKFNGVITDPESNETLEIPFYGSGSDNGDKALYKAITGGLKYFMAANYNVSEDMDPENDEEPKATFIPVEKREEIKTALVDKDGPATKIQKDALKRILKKWRTLDDSIDEKIEAILAETDNLESLTKTNCERMIEKISEKVKELEAK